VRRILCAVLVAVATFHFGNSFAVASLEYSAIAAAAPKPLPPKSIASREELEAFIDGFIGGRLSQGPTAGAVVAVIKDGGVFFSKGYGYEDVEKRVPVDPAQTLFRPGSVSKLFTWTAIMQLVEQGKINLDTDVNQYLKDLKVPATFAQPITLRNIMTHTTGFEDGAVGYLFAASDKDLIPLREFLAKHMPTRVRPPTQDFSNGGVNASYSNYATALAGHIVENISGLSFDEYIEQNIFKPLNMTHSTFREPLSAPLAAHMSGGYEFENGEFTKKGFEFIHSVGPAGALSATAHDMAQFILAHLQGGAVGEARILKPETVALMHSRVMSPDPSLNGHALGFYETWINGRRVIGHGGDTLHFHSALSLLPEANVGLFVSVNTGGEGARLSVDLERAFYQHYFPAELPKLKVRQDAQERNKRYAGSYRTLRRSYTAWEKAFALTGDEKVTALPDGSLLAAVLGEKPVRWIEVGDGVFRAQDDDYFIAFKGNNGGSATNLVSYFAPISSARVGTLGSGMLHMIVGGICILLFVSIIISAIRKRREDRALPRNIRWARPVLALAGALFILFLVLVVLTFAGGLEQLIFKVPATLYVALTFPLLALIPTVAALYYLYVVWKSGAWRLSTRLYYSATTLATVLFLLILNYWNLLGYRFN
jgi:CubicO group peptidase (beta-lactamase class C family)